MIKEIVLAEVKELLLPYPPTPFTGAVNPYWMYVIAGSSVIQEMVAPVVVIFEAVMEVIEGGVRSVIGWGPGIGGEILPDPPSICAKGCGYT